MNTPKDKNEFIIFDGRRLTRRQFLESAAALGLTLTGAGFLAGCSSSSSTTTGASAPATTAGVATTTAIKQGGSLKVGLGGGSEADSLDAHLVGTLPSLHAQYVLYSQLAQLDPDSKIRLGLAESIEPNATGDEWTIRLKQGLEFHNGKTVGADDVIFSLQRILDPNTHAAAAPFLALVDPNGMTKVDELTVRVKMLEPFALFVEAVGDAGAQCIVPVGYDPNNPVGTGPFKYKSFTPGQQMAFERFPNYYAGPAHLDELLFIGIPDDSARVNALLSGQVDVISQIPYAQIPVVEQNSSCKILEAEGSFTLPITMRVDTPPFDDVRVRQAIRLCMDREQAIKVALSGHGTKANDLYSPFDPDFDSSLVRNQDLEQAKALLKEAGKENLTVELVTAPIAAGAVEMCLALAADAAKAGITINVKQVDLGTFYGENYLQWPFSVDWWNGQLFMTMTTVATASGAVFNETHFDDPEFNALFLEARVEPDATKRGVIIRDMQKILFDRGGYLIPFFPNTVDAYRTNVAGIGLDMTGVGLGKGRWATVYFV